MRNLVRRTVWTAVGLAVALTPQATAQCPPDGLLQVATGTASAGCPCFAVGEEAGVVLQAPADHYPIEILKVEITWASVFGGSPQTLENAIHIYPAGLPNPGVPQFSLPGPVMTDGFINQFDIEPIPGNKIIQSGPFMVSLEFGTPNAGNPFAPSIVNDANGCTPNQSTVFAIPGGWNSACVLGVTGDWRIAVEYRRAASVDARNAGTNPLSYTADPIQIGTTWTATVDNGLAGQLTSALFAFDTEFSLLLGGGQTLLALDFGSGELFTGGGLTPLTFGAVDGYSLPIPPDPSLCGLELFTQAIQFGNPPFTLSNSQDLRVGN